MPHHIGELIKQIPDSLKSLWRENDFDPSQVPEMDAYNIEKLLPYLFAMDLKMNLADSPNSVVIFMDTYDSLWKNQSYIVKFRENDEWLRDKLIANVDGSKVLWVICGREQLKWEAIDEDWTSYIKKEPLLVFNENECTYYLENCDIFDKQIQKRICEGSCGNPLYLYLSVNTFHRIKQVKQRAPIIDDFAKTPDGIFERFVKYHKEEIDTLEVLSIPNFWDKLLFEKLVTEFKTGFPLSDNSYLNLHRFSFISQVQNNGWKLHDLMRDSMQERMSPELKVKVHAFMAEHYDSQLELINIKK